MGRCIVKITKKACVNNAGKNLPWMISAVCWYCVEFFQPEYFEISLILASIVVFITGAVNDSIYEKVRQVEKPIWCIAAVSAIGAIGFMVKNYNVNIIMALPALWFAFSCQVLLYSYMKDVVIEVVYGLGKWERVIIIGVSFVYLCFLLFAFMKSNAFYSIAGDLIYTADSGLLMRGNAYLSLVHGENDLRQPLFSVAATPFVGAAYAVSMLFPNFRYAEAYAMGIAQAALLLFTLWMITRMVKKEEAGRIRFFIIIVLTYPSILFSITLEQYIVVLFWTVLYIYLLVEKNTKDGYVLVGAAGSLLISASLVVFDEKKQVFDWKEYVFKIVKIAGMGVWAVLLFCRADVILSVFDKIDMLKQFTGEEVSFTNRLQQFTMFVRSCFVAPPSELNWQVRQDYSWQQVPVEAISVAGILLFVLAVLGFVLNYEKLLYKICMFWVVCSFMVLCVLGWGTAENGLILYTLYYGFAYWILVYGFFDKVLEKFKNCIWRYGMWMIAVIALVVLNGIGILRLLIYARTYYPA